MYHRSSDAVKEPTIPFGYKRVPAGDQTAKGDGYHNGLRFRRVKKQGRRYPIVGERDFVIRPCTVEQLPLLP